VIITTEGAAHGDNGFLIPIYVQRYLISFNMKYLYLPSPSINLKEVYFQEWIPDSIEFDAATMNVVTTDTNEMTHFTYLA